MQTHLEMDIEEIKIKMFEMADLATEAVKLSIESLKNADLELANSIIKNDTRMDRLEIVIDDLCIRLIVTRQPAASDLRFALAMLKINTDIERIGDIASNIARETLKINGAPLIKPLIDIPRMAEIAVKMVHQAFTSISEKDVEKAKTVITMDEEIDDLNMQIYRELFTYMGESSRNISQSLSLIMVAKSLERAGDHAKNIAERAIYYIEGEDIRHRDINKS
ncbi:MAG TPA: phosphate signaling complex protein PhoU [Spirochaetota bacterium]|nr:phosphate signaling complex protein PhoU [Spirochaetota bacterium]HPJ33192.1 phosphate signaling complex protein PhoU [Spirochaetota bacterium]